MTSYKTTCPRDCYDSCGMIVNTTDSEEIISIKGDFAHPITNGFLCPRGNKDIERIKKNRVINPTIKIDDKFIEADWHEAISLVANKLDEIIKNYGKESVLYLDYSGNEGLISNYFAKRLWNYLEVTQTDGALCTYTGHLALSYHYGLSYGIQPKELTNQKVIIFWGFNPAITSPHMWKLVLKARKNNSAKIVVIDPIKTVSAKNADLFL